MTSNFNKSKQNKIGEHFLFYLGAPALVAFLTLLGLTPFIGEFINSLVPFAMFWIYLLIGAASISIVNKKNVNSLLVAILVCSFIFTIPYIIRYHTDPFKITRYFKKEKNEILTYQESKNRMDKMIESQIGDNSFISYILYTERIRLTGNGLGEFLESEISEIDGLISLVITVINIILYIIPMILKWIFFTKLHWVSEPGWIGTLFWYLFAMFLVYMGWRFENK